MSETKQINARIPVELHDALAVHKEETGEEKSAVLVRGIELALGQEPTPPPSDVDALVAALAELRRQKRLNLKYLVAELNEKLQLGPQASRDGSGRAETPPKPLAVDEDEAVAPEAPESSPAADPEHRDGGDSGGSTSDSSTSDEEPESEHVDLCVWVAERLDVPRALARLRVVAGHVEIDGQRYQEETVPAQLLETATVTLNGQPL